MNKPFTLRVGMVLQRTPQRKLGNCPWLNRYVGAKVRVHHIQSDMIALRVLDGKAAGYLALVPPTDIPDGEERDDDARYDSPGGLPGGEVADLWTGGAG
jgi:hypothetical protein